MEEPAEEVIEEIPEEPAKPDYSILAAPDRDEKQAWIRKTLFAHYGVPIDLKLVIYAPSFREDMTAEDMDIDLNRLCRNLSAKTGEEYGAILYFPEECAPLAEKKKNLFVKGISPDPKYEFLESLFGAEYIDTSVTGTDRYYYGVTAYRKEDIEKHYAESDAAEGESGLDMPAITDLIPGMNGLTVKWNPVPGAVRYKIFRQTKMTPEWNDSPWELRRVLLADFTEMLDVSIKNGRESRYRIVAEDGEGKSGRYDEKGLEIYFNRPLIYEVRKAESGQFVTWKPDRRADIYEVYRTVASYVADLSEYPDFTELLLASDAAVGDYADWLKEYAVLGRPCFIYAPDMDRYISREGTRPEMAAIIPVCEDNEDLNEAVEKET